MNDENNQDGATWSPRVNEMNRLSERAAKLSERGAHYFVGWLIGAGMHNPAMMAEFEKVLARLESDPELRHCWRDGSNKDAAVAIPSVILHEQPAVAIAVAAAEVVSAASENLAIVAETPSAPTFEENVHEHTRSGMVKPSHEPAAMPDRTGGFFAKIFRRQRMAA